MRIPNFLQCSLSSFIAFWTTILRLVGQRQVGLIQRAERWTRNRYFDFFAEGGWILGMVLVAQGLANLTPIWSYLPDASFFILTFTGGTLVMPVVIKLVERWTRHPLSLLYGPAGGIIWGGLSSKATIQRLV